MTFVTEFAGMSSHQSMKLWNLRNTCRKILYIATEREGNTVVSDEESDSTTTNLQPASR